MKIVECLLRGLAVGRETGVQLYASRAGVEVVRTALGEARAGAPMTDDTLMFWISTAKPVVGVAYGQQIERGLVEAVDALYEDLGLA